MFIGEVIGAVVATRKTDSMEGLPLRLVRKVSVDNEAGLEDFKKAGGNTIVPLLQVGGSQAQGFEAGRYESLLDSAGFPNAQAARKSP